MFFMGITLILILFLVFVSFGVFLPKPTGNAPSAQLVFNKPNVNIDMNIFNTDEFKNLQPFAKMKIQYSYKATTKDNQQKTGFISATSIDEARKFLQDMGLTVVELQEIEVGRSNPFTPYYVTVVPAKSQTAGK